MKDDCENLVQYDGGFGQFEDHCLICALTAEREPECDKCGLYKPMNDEQY